MSDTNQYDENISGNEKRGVIPVLRRECRRMLQQPVYLTITLLLPVFCYVFFASLTREGMPRQLPLAVIDLDNSALSRSIIRRIDASPQTRIAAHFSDYHEGRSAMQSGDVFGFIIFPKNLQADAMAGRQPQIAFYTTNTYLIGGSLVMRDLSAITALSSASLNIGMRAGRGQSPVEIAANVQPVATDFHTPANPWTSYSIYLSVILSPGLLCILVLLTTVYAMGIDMKRDGAQWLDTAGGSIVWALTGKLLPYTLLFSLMVCAGNTLFFKFLHFPCNGSFFAMQVAGVAMVVAFQAVAIFMLSLLRNFSISLTIAGVAGVLGLSFSGLTFPIEIMDAPLQMFSWAFPIRYYLFIYMNVAMHGLSALNVLGYYLILAAFVLFPIPLLPRLKKMAKKQPAEILTTPA
ncbi:MAG: ABC transporter permease [Bacteroidales bacterium]|jgi:ABC-2 type transport system permease protein|nr:ABC transporter permease [Bacteroidales bacterium]